MVDAGLARTSDTLFWVALTTYAVAMVAYFASLSYRAPRTARVATALAWAGALTHTGSVILRGLSVGRVPWGNMFEYSSMIGLMLVLTYLLYVEARLGMRQIGGFAMGAGVLSLGTAAALYAEAGPLVPALDSNWLRIHVIAAILGSVLFGLSFIFSVLYLFKERAERRARPAFTGSTVGAAFIGSSSTVVTERPVADLDDADAATEPAPEVGGFLGRMPSASKLDALAFRTVQFAFPVWTFAVLAGAVWAHEAWGRYWGWDPKETWAFITWVVYAGYLHARATAGWKGRKAAVINIVGFGVMLFTYFAVNLWISGLHSYAGV